MDEIFSRDFWMDLARLLQHWIITELPGMIIITIIVFVAFRIISLSLRKFRKTLLIRAGRREEANISETEKRLNTLFGIARALINVVIFSVYIMILLKKVGIDIGPIIASAGIIGLAVGFGAQELVRDFITGFFILLENQVREGDVAIINGTGGLVEKIELRTIVLRDFYGTVHIFQNGKISSLSNMTKGWSASVFDIGISYNEDVDRVIAIMQKVGKDIMKNKEMKDKIIEPLEVFGVEEFAASFVKIRARIKTKPIQQWTVGREYRKLLKIAFDREKVEFPFPQTTITFAEESHPLVIKSDGKNPDN